MPHGLLNGSFTDANAQLQQLAADALRAPEHVVFGHRLDKRDDLRRESRRLTTEPGLSSPDNLEEISMPAQHRLRLDDEHGAAPCAGEGGDGEQDEAIEARQLGSLDSATQHDDLLAEQRILDQEF